ncbi:hypothetical protein KQI82_06975 [Oscillibacter sp. MSJ-2]|uniref:Uncharacterized protein n=1 Tax=Dysosmobacter acutus TaxID=2841504 RepID=A0ABS6F8P3_9FIRM|nr:hypothetical protein [Dysosmobacter acutus]MBU5626657.1 hypothetical protein [Dysosmobacter acutus]
MTIVHLYVNSRSPAKDLILQKNALCLRKLRRMRKSEDAPQAREIGGR